MNDAKLCLQLLGHPTLARLSPAIPGDKPKKPRTQQDQAMTSITVPIQISLAAKQNHRIKQTMSTSDAPDYTGGVCCTCARSLNIPIYADSKTEKPTYPSAARLLPCCSRLICSICTSSNQRFETYCPYCQVTTGPSPLPQGLRDPPEYSEKSDRDARKEDERHPPPQLEEEPPGYDSAISTSTLNSSPTSNPRIQSSKDVTHHLHPSDTLTSLSLAYSTPAHILRSHNRLHADHLLAARRTISIPATHYHGPSLSDKPVEDPEETARKAKLRRFMVATKCHEYEVAELYLKQADGDLEAACLKWGEDEKWERENPLHLQTTGTGTGKNKSKTRTGFAGGLTGQI